MKTKLHQWLWLGCLLILWASTWSAQAFYNPQTGHWLSRDPIEEQGGVNLFSFIGNDPIGSIDMLGRLQIAGHTYPTYIVGSILGLSDASQLAYYAAMPDALNKTTAFSFGYPLGKAVVNLITFEMAFPGFSRIQRYLHSLDGGLAIPRRECLRKLLGDHALLPWQRGFLIHALGDSYFHAYDDGSGHDVLFDAPIGHGLKGVTPDIILTHKDKFGAYINDLAQTLNGAPLSPGTQADLNTFLATVNEMDPLNPGGEANFFRGLAIDHGYDLDGYRPEDGMSVKKYESGPGKEYGIQVPSNSDIQSLLKRIKCACSGAK